MPLPEGAQHLAVRGLRRVEHREHHLGVAGAPAAHLFVCGVRCVAAGIAHRGGPHAGVLPEHALRAPEAAHAHPDGLEAVGKWRDERVAEHLVRDGNAY